MRVAEGYFITKKTMALVPYFHPVYRTKIIDVRGECFTSKSADELLKKACLKSGSTYEGRRKAVASLLDYRRRTPIPVSPLQNVFAFPTASPNQFDCAWLFLHHILRIQPHPFQASQAVVTFKDGNELNVKASAAFLRTQFERTAACTTIFKFPDFPHDDPDFFQ